VTSSNCSSLGVYAGTGVPGQKVSSVIGIVKAYTTRVGGGPMPTELTDAVGNRIREVGKEYGTTTGRPRRCGWLDLVLLRYALRINGVTELVLTKLDVLTGLSTIRLGVGYQAGGQTYAELPMGPSDLSPFQPVYESLPGWTEDLSQARTLADLPPAARAYVARIEELTGVPVSLVSVGPERSQIVRAD
jgi:adenylosuccinate synthase